MKTVKKLLATTGAAMALMSAGAMPISNATIIPQEQQIKAVPTVETKVVKKRQSLRNLRGGGNVTGLYKIPSSRQHARSSFKQNKRRGL
jgi:hypothetical protein